MARAGLGSYRELLAMRFRDLLDLLLMFNHISEEEEAARRAASRGYTP